MHVETFLKKGCDGTKAETKVYKTNGAISEKNPVASSKGVYFCMFWEGQRDIGSK